MSSMREDVFPDVISRDSIDVALIPADSTRTKERLSFSLSPLSFLFFYLGKLLNTTVQLFDLFFLFRQRFVIVRRLFG